MCGPMRGGVMAGLVYAKARRHHREEAEKLASSGRSNTPLSRTLRRSAPWPASSRLDALMIVRNEKFGNTAYCTPTRASARCCATARSATSSPSASIGWKTVLYPVLKAALAHSGPIDLKNLIAQALHMGDEFHNRNRAAPRCLYRALAPAIVATLREQGRRRRRSQFHQRSTTTSS
jgi:hypothetical protein